jgi:hypothetical protein
MMTFIIDFGIGQFRSCPGQAISPYSPLPTTPAGARDVYRGRKKKPQDEGFL